MGFSEAQQAYLEGLGRGIVAARTGSAGTAARPARPEDIHRAAQDRQVEQGGKLTREEDAKRERHPFDIWDEMVARAGRAEYPKALEVFRYKFHGLFYVAPAQDSFMCRLRIPNGILSAHQLRAVADIAAQHGAGYAHVTTRANLQVREIGAAHAVDVLQALAEAGLTSRGAGADNVRNITGSPTAGVDVVELYDTRPLGRALHHAILNHRELYGLPRKFNIAFDGGGSVASLEDTNDIGFQAVAVPPGCDVPPGVHFRVAVGGITGHGDFAADLGVVVPPSRCLEVALAIVRVFIDEGDRTDRTRARLKYVLERMGLPAFLAAVEALLATPLPRLAQRACLPRPPLARGAHVGFHAQRQPGRVYCGVALPAGRLSAAQMHGLAAVASRHGSGTLRLTVWQNVIVSDLATGSEGEVETALRALGLTAHASPVRAGIVACTGNTGCKFSASDTKRHALAIVDHLEARVALDTPLNVHLTGCPHSCAQHYVGDIGLLGTRVAQGDAEPIEGYHVFVGGGFGDQRGLGREVMRDVPSADIPLLLERLLTVYLDQRAASESFADFVRRHAPEQLRALAGAAAAPVARAA
jgi:ferredoxin-nitrite reductase